MILVDTSVWVEHLRKGSPRLVALLEDAQVLCHPFVQGELACGNLRRRGEILSLLLQLPCAIQADHAEALRMTEVKHLHGVGLGWIDVHLLASARLTGCGLWTLDQALERAASSLSIRSS